MGYPAQMMNISYAKPKTYATWNPSDKSSNMTLSNGNLTVTTNTGSTWGTVRANMGKSSGKWYWEMTMTTTNANQMVGVFNGTPAFTSYVGETADGWTYFANGQKIHTNSFVNYGASYASGDIIGVALDMDNGTIEFFKNGTSQGQAYTGLSGTFYPAQSMYSVSAFVNTVNFGASAFSYSVPSGFNSGFYNS